MKPHHVDSKEHKLSENDIMLVSAYEYPEAAQKVWKKMGSPEGVAPERVLYSHLCRFASQPNMLRVREGNTLFLVSSKDGTTADVLMFNADTPKNTIRNCAEFFDGLRKHFKTVKANNLSEYVVSVAQMAFKRHQQEGDTMNVSKDSFTYRFA